MTEQTEAEKVIAPGLLNTIRRWSMLIELVHDVAFMRHYQKSFFRERSDEKIKKEFLTKAREYEARVDKLLQLLWPAHEQQQKLF
jgi:hypothetical protein